MLIILCLYFVALWLVFSKFKVVRWGWLSGTISVVIGRGVTQDYTEAVMWFRKAADQGDAVAELLLGNHYAFGNGVPQDYSEAMSWFRMAAGQGHPKRCMISGSSTPRA